MHWILALHIIAVVCWFAGLFYLPRLFVYHANTPDSIGYDRFLVMEHKLLYYITWPAGIITTLSGFWLLSLKWEYYAHQNWMHAKLILVLLLWLFHFYNGILLGKFKQHKNPFSHKFFRFFNEIPTIILIAVVILAIVKPIITIPNHII